ncbi:AraC family transcriptional regulator [Sphingomonas sp. CBMAI 2297]|uniref:AraC family transcriptional regulator n=1 Tax=Sphingomonas sp. CBMAI 2297 TaxID=2991720 RepID=UPI0024549FA9|nr:AraC family transcriptional regulator [Sphingomonas sp. CBMAI 2297]MDH4745334.1 AraC family transcriptional regulator [Sphingomonas sp. CBMAI 2297]
MTAPIGKHDFARQAAPTVSAGYAGYLWRFAVARGADAAELARRSGIDPAGLADPDIRVPFARYQALMRAAKELCRMPALALHLGAGNDFREFSVVGLICYAAPTMGEALAELNRYGRLVAEVDLAMTGPRFRIEQRDGGTWLTDTRADPNAFPEMTEASWARFIGETRRHFPDAPFALAVHVTHAAPAHAAEYEAVLGVPVTFASDRNAIRIDPSWLGIALHNPSRYAFGVLSERADRLMRALESAKSMRGRVEGALMPMLHRGDATMEAVARKLGLSRRSLQRRLKDEDSGFEAVLDALRHRMALNYLSGGRTSVNETAYLVGFSDPSAFSRAFKRWTGTSPRGWLERECQGRDAFEKRRHPRAGGDDE